ncbi:hypothetical protein K469DRAFT_490456, partial [Zopfia rhizophila CBS 207.26]
INHILREYLDVFILAYLDNILVYINRILKEYIKYTKKTGKYMFHRKKVKFLGYIISRNRIAVNSDKAK